VHPNKLLRHAGFRLALLYLALFSTSVLLLFGFIYWATVGYQARQIEAEILADSQRLAVLYRQHGDNALVTAITEQLTHTDQPHSVLLLTDKQGRLVAGNLEHWPLPDDGTDGWHYLDDEDNADQRRNGHDIELRILTLAGGERLLVGRIVDDLDKQQDLIIGALLGGLSITVALGLIGGTLLSLTSMRKIERISTTLHAIMAGDLGRRITTVAGDGDNIDQLGADLNAMLDQIQSLMESLHQVSNDIAHDLRTPLSRLRGQLESLYELTSDDALRERIEAALAETDGLLTTFNALLRIAQLEADGARQSFGPVDLGRVAGDIVEFYEPLATDKQQTLTLQLDEHATLQGDRDLLFQALANLLDNAIKYTPAGGIVTLSVTVDSAEIRVCVADTGPGIPAAQYDKVLRRFYRLEQHRGQPGNGLGLSLVAAIAKRHQGRLLLSDNHPGLRVTLNLPR
jgi:signal transduction histidine kinase